MNASATGAPLIGIEKKFVRRNGGPRRVDCHPARPRSPRREISDTAFATGVTVSGRARDDRRVRRACAGRREPLAAQIIALGESLRLRVRIRRLCGNLWGGDQGPGMVGMMVPGSL